MIKRNDVFNTLRDYVNQRLEDTGSNLRFGDHKPPVGAVFPYGIMYDVGGGGYGNTEYTPPFTDYTEGNFQFEFQFSIVGDGPDMVRISSDHLVGHMLSKSDGVWDVPAPAGWRVIEVEPGEPSDPIIEGQEPSRIYTLPETYLVELVPA